LRIRVKPATGQKNSLHTGEKPGYAVLTLMKWDQNRRCPRGAERSKIGRQRALVVR
jgi:hypothetical protein